MNPPKEKIQQILTWFESQNPTPTTELRYRNPFELLVAVVLSAQCTDKRVNLVTEKLFQDFPTVNHFAHTTFDELFPYIRSVSYPNNKTQYLIALSKILVEKHQSGVPESFDDLLALPGVGRKTANVLVSVLFDQPTVPVDTHVFRVSKRIGLVSPQATTPLEVEKQLTALLPVATMNKTHHWLILHGRYVCIARKPKCEQCLISKWCDYFQQQVTISGK